MLDSSFFGWELATATIAEGIVLPYRFSAVRAERSVVFKVMFARG